MRFRSAFVVVLMMLLIPSVHGQQIPPYKNPKLSIEERVKDLLSRMTPEEKFWQLYMIPGDLDNATPEQYKNGLFGFQVSAGSKAKGETQQLLTYNTNESGEALAKKINVIQKYFVERTRLGIPIIAFDEGLHGLVREGATAFPQSIGLAATFDTTLMRQVSTAIALETKGRGIRQILSPVINSATDVRWGRVEETYGEDPFLTSAMAVAYVSSFEKMDIVTTPKHLIANVGDGGRDSYPIHLNERFMEEIHFPPFKACFAIGGTRSVMTSYNTYDGVACSANDWLLNQKLKKEWKFDGFVISDANATGGSVVLHNTASDYADASRQAISGGLDVIFQTEFEHYKLFSESLLDANRDQKRIDDAVSRVLRAKFQLGLFEQPYVSEDALSKLVDAKRHKEIAKKAALESIVLLKNEGKTLPLSKGLTVALFGEDAAEARLGGYSGPGNKKVSILEGLRSKLGEKKVLYAEGCKRMSEPYVVVGREFLSDGKAPGIQAEYYNNITLAGQPIKTTRETGIDFNWTISSPDPAIKNDFYSARWNGVIRSPKTGTFKIGLQGNDGYRLYIEDKLAIDRWEKQSYHTDVIDFKFEKDRAYRFRVEFFEPVGNGQIQLVWNVPVDQDWKKGIEEAVAVAKKADVAVIVAGIHEGEFQDRAFLSLPGHQEMLIQQIAATGKPVVVVLVGGSAVTMSSWIDKAKGIVDVWYPGEEGGHAVADVLLGDYNPAGRLPITFPIHEAQLPLMYNHKPTGRGDDYHNLSGLPLFPFGYGLSYTTFAYSDLKMSSSHITVTEAVEVSFTLKNVGTVGGDEVCQLYIKDELASVARPVLELKGFQRIHLNPGESKNVVFKITPELLKMFNREMREVVEPGDFRIMIGASSRDIRLVGVLTAE